MIHVECYSAKGLAVKGASAEQAEAIRAALGAAVVTAFDAKRGGWLFSRKREDRIRELAKAMQPTEANAEQDGMPGEWFKRPSTGSPAA